MSASTADPSGLSTKATTDVPAAHGRVAQASTSMSGEHGEIPLQWDAEDCFWCGTVFDPSTGPCPHCASTIQTGKIKIISDGEIFDL